MDSESSMISVGPPSRHPQVAPVLTGPSWAGRIAIARKMGNAGKRARAGMAPLTLGWLY